MSANNIVVIRRESDGMFRGYHRDYDAHCEGQYDYDGPCPYCGGDVSKCDLCDGGHYSPPKETPVFEVDTIEGAVQAYSEWLDKMNDNEEGFLFVVEYGYVFEGLKPNKTT